MKGKPSKEEVKGVVYKVPFECGAGYIGETGHNLHTRLQEHRRAVANGDTKNHIAIHVMENNHVIQWKDVQVIASEPHLIIRKVKESLLTKRTSNSMNLDKGPQLANICYPQ